MSELHREKTLSVTQKYSRRYKKATLQSGACLAATQGRPTHRLGRLPALSSNQLQPHESYLHHL